MQTQTTTYTGWVSKDDLKSMLAVPGPWTADDERYMDIVVTGVNNYIHRVRPDLVPPVVTNPPPAGSPVFIAFSREFNPAFNGAMARLDHGGEVFWAAVQMAMKWWEKRGESESSGFDEFGPLPSMINREMEEALQIGRAHRPVVA